MRSLSLIWMCVVALAVTGPCWAQPGSAQDLAIERAIALGKGGQFEEGLAQLNPYLKAPSASEAKACYVAGFLLKERFKKDNMPGSLSGDRADALRWLRQAEKALGYLGGTYFDDVVQGVDAFEPGQEARILELFEAHEAVASYLDANLDATAERTEIHKNMARAYRQWFEATGDEAHFQGIVLQYEQALALSPRDMTATYNLAVNIYNRDFGHQRIESRLVRARLAVV